jgi:hypothetical protein
MPPERRADAFHNSPRNGKNGVANVRLASRRERRSPARVSGLAKVVQVEKTDCQQLPGQQRYPPV